MANWPSPGPSWPLPTGPAEGPAAEWHRQQTPTSHPREPRAAALLPHSGNPRLGSGLGHRLQTQTSPRHELPARSRLQTQTASRQERGLAAS
eukprot:9663964-Alexandrium_andersonii.AAC.1